MTQPLTPPDCDVRSLDEFDLNVERLMASELVALSTGDEFKAAVMLWCRAWKQVPAASLPDDDRILASFAGLPLGKWRKVRPMALRGFIKALDGRLYHPVLAGQAVKGAASRKKFLEKREADAERLREWRASQKGNTKETRSETPGETRFVASVPVPVPVLNLSHTELSPPATEPGPVAREKSARAVLAERIAAAIGVPNFGALPPNIAGNLMAEVESMIAQNCDWTADIAPALARKPDGKWPGSPTYWTKIAISNRDRRAASPGKFAPPPATTLHPNERDKRIRAWLRNGEWAASWGPGEGENGCCITPAEWAAARKKEAA